MKRGKIGKTLRDTQGRPHDVDAIGIAKIIASTVEAELPQQDGIISPLVVGSGKSGTDLLWLKVKIETLNRGFIDSSYNSTRTDIFNTTISLKTIKRHIK